MLFGLCHWKREFSFLSLIVSLCFLNVACATKPQNSPELLKSPLSILQGRTSSTETELSILVPQSLDPIIQVRLDSANILRPTLRERVIVPQSTWAIEKVKFEGLLPGKIYSLEDLSKDNEKIDERTFRTLPSNMKDLRFAMISCTDDHFKAEQKVMWSHLMNTRPDVIFHLGDHVYADKVNGVPIWEANVETLWKRYLETRQSLDFYFWKDLRPMLILWDDHDFGQNDGDVRYQNKREATEIFQAFSAQRFPAQGFESGPGVSWSWTTPYQDFYFLDGRSFRSPNKPSPACKDNPSPLCKKLTEVPGFKETHFGEEQEAWLFQKLQSSSRPAWLFSGDQWFGGNSPFESYEGNANLDFKRFTSRLADLPKTFVFGSGDRHAIELMKIPKGPLDFVTYEITSSPLHAKTFSSPWKDFPNPRNLEQFAGMHNFVMVKTFFEDRKRGVRFEVEGYGPDGKSLFKRNLSARDPKELPIN